MNVDIRPRFSFHGPIVILGGSLLLVAAIIGAFVFFSYVAGHWQQYNATTPLLVNGFFVFLACCAALVPIAGVLLLIGRARKGRAEIEVKRAEAARIRAEAQEIAARQYVPHALPTYAVVRQPDTGKIELLAAPPVRQERYNVRINDIGTTPQGALPPPQGEDAPPLLLPRYIRYAEVRPYIPRGHALVGVAPGGPVTKVRDDIRGLVWVVGGSNTGKSNTVAIRVAEDAERGHLFVGIDPHRSKPDSLYHSTREYEAQFLYPMARATGDSIQVLDHFLAEGEQRVRTGRWHDPWTLLVDEVGKLTSFLETDEEKELARKLKEVARFCGQEARGFEMCAVMISQTATGLSWVRRDAGMVIAHQVNTFNERLLVCNQDREIARQMDHWPKGRTFIYGLGIEEGPGVYQQPVIDDDGRRSRFGVQTEPYEPEPFTYSEPYEPSLQADVQEIEAVQQLRSQGFNKEKIILNVWNAKKGGSAAYQEASRKYDEIIAMRSEEEGL